MWNAYRRHETTWNCLVPTKGQSLWWQVLNPNGVGVGLWAQISFKDSLRWSSLAAPPVMIKKVY